MKAKVKLADNLTLEIEDRDEFETMAKAIVLAHPRTHCNECGNEKGFYFVSNKDKEGNVYINYKCPSCEAKSKLGRYKTGGYFWKDFEKYNPDKKVNQQENYGDQV
jgi:transposase-like protein